VVVLDVIRCRLNTFSNILVSGVSTHWSCRDKSNQNSSAVKMVCYARGV